MDAGKRGENSSSGDSRGIDMKMSVGPGMLASWMRPDCLEPRPPPTARDLVLTPKAKCWGWGVGQNFFDQDYI